MWWRFLVFCVLVSIVLFVVLSCIHGRPVIHLFFHRCCEEDIENDQVIFENFGNNFLRERLVGADIVVDDNESFASEFDVDEVLKSMREKIKESKNNVLLKYDNDSSEEIESNRKLKFEVPTSLAKPDISAEVADYENDVNAAKHRTRERTTRSSMSGFTENSNYRISDDPSTVNSPEEFKGIPLYQIDKWRSEKYKEEHDSRYPSLNLQDDVKSKQRQLELAQNKQMKKERLQYSKKHGNSYQYQRVPQHKWETELKKKEPKSSFIDESHDYDSEYGSKVLKAVQDIINVHNPNSRHRVVLLSLGNGPEAEAYEKEPKLVTDMDFVMSDYSTDYPNIPLEQDTSNFRQSPEIEEHNTKVNSMETQSEIPLNILNVNVLEPTLSSVTEAVISVPYNEKSR